MKTLLPSKQIKRLLLSLPPHIWVVLSNWISRAGSVIAQLICLPILSNFLSPAEFAAYAITVSLITWYHLTDFGYGNSAKNFIAEARALGSDVGHLIAASTTVAIAALLITATALYPLSKFLGDKLIASLDLSHQTNPQVLMQLSGTLFACSAVGMTATKLLYALHRGVLANAILLLNSVSFLMALLFVTNGIDSEDPLSASVLAYSAPMAITGLATLVHLALTQAKWEWAKIGRAIGHITPSAVQFWLFALMSAAVLNVDYFIMSQTLPPEEIATYNVLFRIFWVGMALYSGLLGAIWPIFSGMNAHGNLAGIRRKVHTYLLAGLLALAAGSTIASMLLPDILKLLTPGLSIQVSHTTFILFTTYIGFRIWTDTYATALQAIGEVRILLKVVPIQAGTSIFLQYILSLHFGVNGILLGLILSFLLTVSWALPAKLRRHVQKSNTLGNHT